MWSRPKKKLVWIYLIITLFVGISMVYMTVSASTAVLSASLIIDTTKTPGSTFSINITIANVEKMWGYQFIVYYNTTVLNATDYSSYDPFTMEAVTQINDTAGWVFLSYTMPFGETVGFSTADPAPIARIEFTVDGLGISTLHMEETGLPSVPIDGEPIAIAHDTHDGFFANVEVPIHDIAVTSVTVSSTSVLVNETVTVTATFKNEGDFDETFNASAYYDTTLIETKTGIALSAGAETTSTFTWDTELVSPGEYTINVVASVVPDEIDTADNSKLSSLITVRATGDGQEFFYIIVAAIVIIVVAAILIYLLKFRKS